MSITVECECGSQFRLADKAAVRTIRCKDCDEPIEVPERRREVDDEEPGFDEATFESNSERHQVSMTASPAAAACLTVERLEETCEELVEYLDASPDAFKKSDLQLEVDIEVHTKLVVAVKVRARGSINGKPFHKKFEQIFEDYSEGAMFAAGGAGQALMGKALQSVMRNLSKNPDAHGGLQQKFEKIKYDLFDAFDRSINRKASSSAGRWKTIFYSSFAAIPVFVLVTIGLVLSRGGSIVPAVIFGVFAGVPGVFLVMSAGLIFMPDSFYEREAAGRRALKFTGAKSPAAGRVVAVFSCLAMIGAISWSLYIAMTIDMN